MKRLLAGTPYWLHYEYLMENPRIFVKVLLMYAAIEAARYKFK